MPRLFALDHNFPDPIVAVLTEYQADAELIRVDAIDDRLPDLDDWELLLALHHHEQPWDGLITTDSGMLNQGRELATLMQTKLTLIVAMESGHNPVKPRSTGEFGCSVRLRLKNDLLSRALSRAVAAAGARAGGHLHGA